MLLITAQQQYFNRLPIWLKESEPAGMMRGFVKSVETVFLLKNLTELKLNPENVLEKHIGVEYNALLH